MLIRRTNVTPLGWLAFDAFGSKKCLTGLFFKILWWKNDLLLWKYIYLTFVGVFEPWLKVSTKIPTKQMIQQILHELKSPPHITFWSILLPQKLGVFKRKANEQRGSWHPGGDRSVFGLLEGSGHSTCPGDPKWCCCSEKKNPTKNNGDLFVQASLNGTHFWGESTNADVW